LQRDFFGLGKPITEDGAHAIDDIEDAVIANAVEDLVSVAP
jgi:hypothetical protein